MVTPQQRSQHGALDKTRGSEGAIDIFNLPCGCQNLVWGFKLASEPPSRVAAHGVADHQGSLETITLGTRESAEFVTRWAGRNAGQDRAGLAVLTTRALYNAKRRPGW